MPAIEAPAARSALPLYLLSLGGLAACVGAALIPALGEHPPNYMLSVALPVAVVALLANAASLLAMLRVCSASAALLRRSAGLEPGASSGNGLTRLARAVVDVDETFSRMQREIERLNHADPLTGLGNRRWLQIVASRAFAVAEMQGTGLSALMLRVDFLQEINQRFGHDAGDRALLGCADLLKRLVRRSDCVARISGNEFLILLPGTRGDAAAVVGRRISECLATFPQSLLGDAPLTTRLYIAEWRGEKMLEALLARAQAGLDLLPVGDPDAVRPPAIAMDLVARQDMALVGVRPLDDEPVSLRRRETDE